MKLVDHAYVEFDDDRAMLERSIDLSSQELLKANSDMRAILRAFPDIVFRIDASGLILDCRGGSAPDFQIPPEKLIGRRMTDVPDPAASAIFRDAIRKTVTSRKAATVEYSITVQGHETFNEARLIPVGSNELIVVVRNITKQRQAGEDLQRQRSYLRNIIDMLPHLLFVKDRGERFTLSTRPPRTSTEDPSKN